MLHLQWQAAICCSCLLHVLLKCTTSIDGSSHVNPGARRPTAACNHAHLRHRLEHRQLRHLGGRAALRSHLGGNGGSIIVLVELWRAGQGCMSEAGNGCAL